MFTKFFTWLASLFAPKSYGSSNNNVRRFPEVRETTEPSIYEKLYATAAAEMGVSEVSGSKDNPRIVEYHEDTSLSADDDETPWCASFVGWCLKENGIKGTRSARAKSYLEWGVELKEPVRGCIVVFGREGGGHVAFYDSHDDENINVLGGNQGNKVCIKPYAKERFISYRGLA